MKKAVIFLHGDKADVLRVKNSVDNQTLIIGCDGGTQYAVDLGFIPHAIVGDMDSLSNKLKKNLQKKNVLFVSYPKEKNNTDAELALLYAVKRGCKKIIITGILGTRVDHFLASILMLSQTKFSSLNIQIIEGDQDMFVVRKKIALAGKKGDTVSIIPIMNTVEGVTTKSLEYVLTDATLPFGTTRGISNIFTKNEAEITLKKGTMLVIHTKKKS
jgi:thiamine pyrophosphokinase